jgi:hypothetical protein
VLPLFDASVDNEVQYTVAHPESTKVVASGSLLTLSCELGFHATGNRFSTCGISGAFNATLSECVPVLCHSLATLNLPPRAYAVPASIRYLETAVVTCESGYRFENGSAEIVASCDAYGNLSLAAPAPLCLRIPNFCEVRRAITAHFSASFTQLFS